MQVVVGDANYCSAASLSFKNYSLLDRSVGLVRCHCARSHTFAPRLIVVIDIAVQSTAFVAQPIHRPMHLTTVLAVSTHPSSAHLRLHATRILSARLWRRDTFSARSFLTSAFFLPCCSRLSAEGFLVPVVGHKSIAFPIHFPFWSDKKCCV